MIVKFKMNTIYYIFERSLIFIDWKYSKTEVF